MVGDDSARLRPVRLLTRLGVGALVLALLCVLAIWSARAAVELVYRGDLLPGLLSDRNVRPLDFYIGVSDRIVITTLFTCGVIAAIIDSLRYRSVPIVLGLLLLGDLVLCVVGQAYSGLLAISLDRGIPEWFQYFKEAGTTWFLYRLARRTRRAVFVGLAALFAFLLVDDALEYHEFAGQLLGRLPSVAWVASLLDVRPSDIGELLSLAPVGAATLLLLTLPRFRETADIRRVIQRYAILVAALVLTGGVLDVLDRVVLSLGYIELEGVLHLVEDGGEMILMSVAFAYTLAVSWRFRDTAAGSASRLRPIT